MLRRRLCVFWSPVKTLDQMLQELARPEVTEFAMVSDRLPCIKVEGKYVPIDDRARSTEAIIEMLVESGGARYMDEMQGQPVAWTTRMEDLGSVGIQAVMREGRVQARFTVVRRPSVRAMPAAAPAQHAPHSPPRRKSQRAMAPASIEDDPALERASNPGIRAVDVHPRLGPLDTLLSQARELGATDVHVIAARPMLARIGGDLLPQGKPLDIEAADAMIREISCPIACARPSRSRAPATSRSSARTPAATAST